jgi:adenine specific DNA methylase Mod
VPKLTIEGDNLTAMRDLWRSEGQCVALAYLDPPFASGQLYKTAAGEIAFDDRWPSLDEYLSVLERRLWTAKELLLPRGSIVVHVDPKTSGYVRVLGDKVFGANAFASEVVWRYRRWPAKTPNFQRVHDVLLRWRASLNVEPIWNQLYEPLAASTIKTWGTGKQLAVVEGGKRKRSSTTAVESPGVPMGDVWDIGIIAPVARERVDYPTQKPEKLLERLILSLTNVGDLVLDPYCGSGTTLAVAEKLGRQYVGIDESPIAIRVTRTRLATLCEEVARG